jgi:hypothetical protein
MTASGLRREPPGRYLAYMAGRSTPLYLRMLARFVELLGPRLESLKFVIGDLPSYRWAQAQPRDPRVELIYQHAGFDPFRPSGRGDVGRLAELEVQYGDPNLWRYVLAHRMIDRLAYDAKLAYLQAYLEYFDGLWRQYTPDVFISGTPDSLPFITSYEVFRRNGSIPLILIPSRIPRKFHVVDNDMEQVPGLDRAYAALQSRSLTAPEKALASAVRDAYVIRKMRPAHYGIGVPVRPLPSPRRALAALSRRVRGDRYFGARLRDDVRQSLQIRARWPAQTLALQRLGAGCPEDGRFFYYPLHYEPEFSIDILGSTCRDQLQVLERVSAALPAGYRLCVKEHPDMFPGCRPVGFYRRLAALGNVVLLHPSTDSYGVLPRCAGVVTISGTTGFEALFHGKPVLLFGRAFYEVFSAGVTRAQTYEQVAGALGRMVEGATFDPDELDRFVAAVFQRSYDGEVRWDANDLANAAALAEGLTAELEYRVA